jgi:hypothetical protein
MQDTEGVLGRTYACWPACIETLCYGMQFSSFGNIILNYVFSLKHWFKLFMV